MTLGVLERLEVDLPLGVVGLTAEFVLRSAQGSGLDRKEFLTS